MARGGNGQHRTINAPAARTSNRGWSAWMNHFHGVVLVIALSILAHSLADVIVTSNSRVALPRSVVAASP